MQNSLRSLRCPGSLRSPPIDMHSLWMVSPKTSASGSDVTGPRSTYDERGGKVGRGLVLAKKFKSGLVSSIVLRIVLIKFQFSNGKLLVPICL